MNHLRFYYAWFIHHIHRHLQVLSMHERVVVAFDDVYAVGMGVWVRYLRSSEG